MVQQIRCRPALVKKERGDVGFEQMTPSTQAMA
jgi:hypothetical protein